MDRGAELLIGKKVISVDESAYNVTKLTMDDGSVIIVDTKSIIFGVSYPVFSVYVPDEWEELGPPRVRLTLTVDRGEGKSK